MEVAKKLQADGSFKEAEKHFVEGGDWKGAVQMYRAAGMWEGSLRLAKAHGGPLATKQVRDDYPAFRSDWCNFRTLPFVPCSPHVVHSSGPHVAPCGLLFWSPCGPMWSHSSGPHLLLLSVRNPSQLPDGEPSARSIG